MKILLVCATFTLILETWPTTGHGLPGKDDIEQIRVPGFPDAATCERFGQASQNDYDARVGAHFTRHLLGWTCIEDKK